VVSLCFSLLDGGRSQLIEDNALDQCIAQLGQELFSRPANPGQELGVGGDPGDEPESRRPTDILGRGRIKIECHGDDLLS
jgi:hypothetical protein